MLAADAEPGGSGECKHDEDHGRDERGDRRNDVSHTKAGSQPTRTPLQRKKRTL